MTILVVNKGNFSHVELKNQKAPSSCPYLKGSGGKRRVHKVVQGTEVRLSHLTSSSKLFAVLSNPIKTHYYANIHAPTIPFLQ